MITWDNLAYNGSIILKQLHLAHLQLETVCRITDYSGVTISWVRFGTSLSNIKREHINNENLGTKTPPSI